MHAASTSYWAEIAPEPRLRGLVLTSGALLSVAGLAIVPVLAVSTGLKAALAGAWIALSGYEWSATRRAYSRSDMLRIAAGGLVERRCPDGAWQPARLCGGSVVLPRFAWLRVAPDGARPYAELVSGRGQKSEDWRRLQVIWRHIGAA